MYKDYVNIEKRLFKKNQLKIMIWKTLLVKWIIIVKYILIVEYILV